MSKSNEKLAGDGIYGAINYIQEDDGDVEDARCVEREKKFAETEGNEL